jgi:hypothetical protein
MMWRFLLIAFLIAHGLVHLPVWVWVPKPKDGKEMPFDSTYSWLLGNQKALATVVALAAAVLLITGGVALWAHVEWWRPVGLTGLALSFGLMVLYFNPWFLFIEGVNAALIVGLARLT